MSTLFLQFREDKTIAEHERKCFFKGFKKKVKFYNVFADEFGFLNEKNFTRIIVGGSGEFSLSDRNKKPKLWKKVKRTIPFLKKEIDNNTNILGVCFGHQLIAFSLGSEVKPLLAQKETGTFQIYLTSAGKKDKLFYNFPEKFLAQEGHKDSILKLPKEAVILAKSKKCKIQAFRYKNARGTQFHPELAAKDINFRLFLYPDYLSEKRKPRIKETRLVRKALGNFYGI